jgi:hypothetical protein
MNAIKFGNQKDLVLRSMLERLSFYEQQAFTLDQEIRKNAKVSEDVKLLISIPAVLIHWRHKEVPELRQISFILWHCTCKPGFLIHCA